MATTDPTPRPDDTTLPARSGDGYTPRAPGNVECPACGAVLATLPPAVLRLACLPMLRCATCGQEWHELIADGGHTRYWAAVVPAAATG